MEKKYTFSQRLRELLQIFDIKQTELSIKTGISKSSISHYLKGDWEGKQDAVYKIASAFGISEAWLMGVDVPLYPVPPVDAIELDIGNIIHSRRTELDLTMKQVADAVGVSEATVSRWEAGNIKNIKRDKIALLSEALKLSPLTFITGEVQPITVSPAPAGVELTPHEQEVLAAYRAKAEMQKAVDTLLGVAPAPAPTIADDMKNTIALGEAVFGKTRTAAK